MTGAASAVLGAPPLDQFAGLLHRPFCAPLQVCVAAFAKGALAKKVSDKSMRRTFFMRLEALGFMACSVCTASTVLCVMPQVVAPARCIQQSDLSPEVSPRLKLNRGLE